ncbi:UDP-glucose:undecaprenyl-phosphate glucose-1-phosphate transferase [bioreactor metagenome]|uniref:UDP-glucose:undecaprenyl-phosphate glucose-1-phosphate transferase n=1 Tax=bioreactor metagenome TaxID=1076179 RepID=A0A645G7E0_9ZZZZ
MAALSLLSPLFLIIAAAIKIDSDGSVFFKQKRLTKNGTVFHMYKFRSMVVGAEKMGAGLFNYENDPRVTRVGRFLRHSSLDELPQLINVLKGEMSLVGPRPCVDGELGDYETLNVRYKKRFTVLPGMTGYAQVCGRNDISWDEKVTLDNAYIALFKKYGVWIDIKILFKTAVNILAHRDIYEKKSDAHLDDAQSAEISMREIIEKAHAAEAENDEELK